jgi:hypothetical protein
MPERSDTDDQSRVVFGSDDAAVDPRERGPLEPGSPRLENALFVLAGASGTIVFLSSVI